MGVIVLDGLPGVGKSFVAREVLAGVFGYHFHDADADLPEDEIRRIREGLRPTSDMRLDHVRNVVESVRRLERNFANLVVANAFMRNEYRRYLCDRLPQVSFFLVVCNESVRNRRLGQRENHLVRKELALSLADDYELPLFCQAIINNDFDGTENLLSQLAGIIRQDQVD